MSSGVVFSDGSVGWDVVTELVLSSVVGFVLLIVASYIGTTMALCGYFGREYRSEKPSLSPSDDTGGREADSEDP